MSVFISKFYFELIEDRLKITNGRKCVSSLIYLFIRASSISLCQEKLSWSWTNHASLKQVQFWLRKRIKDPKKKGGE